MFKGTKASLGLLAVLPLVFAGCTAVEQEIIEARARYQKLFRGDEAELALSGRMAEANERLLSAVPDGRKTAGDYLVLGNILYSLDPDRSFEYHKRAYDAYPHWPEIVYEMALEHHRRRDCRTARALYEELADIEEGQSRAMFALLAQCYLQEGRYEDAVTAWRRADYHGNHTGIDFAIHAVFGDRSPLARQNDLVHDVRAGKGAVADLLLVGLEWNPDWWNVQVNQQALAAALAVIAEVHGEDSVEAREARLLIDVTLARAKGAGSVKRVLENAGFNLDGRLPMSSFVAKRILAVVMEAGLLSPSEVEERFRGPLLERIAARDKEALDILAHLYAETGAAERLRELDLRGWKEFQDPSYAMSYLLGLPGDDPSLQQTLDAVVSDFPQDSRILYLLYLFEKERGRADPALLSRLIVAEYHGLKNDRSRSGRTLDSFYAKLEALLRPAPSP